MKTPKDYTSNLANKIITPPMLDDCLYSVNKRAKNCRDKVREYRNRLRWNCYPCLYENYLIQKMRYEERMDEYYAMKDKLLALIQPTCIHHEIYFNRYEIEDCYYLFYKLPKHTFHHPISAPNDEQFESWAKKTYEGLEIVTLDDNIETYGDDTDNLISYQFVKKVIALIDSGDFTYQTAAAQRISTESEYRQCA